MTVAVSTAGVFRTKDGGASWAPSNKGVSAVFLPDPNPEFGQCVHKVTRDAADPDRLYLQNHWGVFRSDDSRRPLVRHRRGPALGFRVRRRRAPAPR